jgi:hypothetical protein
MKDQSPRTLAAIVLAERACALKAATFAVEAASNALNVAIDDRRAATKAYNLACETFEKVLWTPS